MGDKRSTRLPELQSVLAILELDGWRVCIRPYWNNRLQVTMVMAASSTSFTTSDIGQALMEAERRIGLWHTHNWMSTQEIDSHSGL